MVRQSSHEPIAQIKETGSTVDLADAVQRLFRKYRESSPAEFKRVIDAASRVGPPIDDLVRK